MRNIDISMPCVVLSKYGIQTILRKDNRNIWDIALQSMAYTPIAYSGSLVDYQNAYWTYHSDGYMDLSMIILHNDKPCALWTISIKLSDGQYKLGSLGDSLLQPIFISDTPLKTRKNITSACINAAIKIGKELGQTIIESQTLFLAKLGLGEWHQKIIQHNASVSVLHDLYLDLKPELTSLKSNFRKSYKSLISSGEKLWNVGVLDKQDDDTWAEYRLLHLDVAGRETRSIESWNKQHDAIKKQEAFLVYLRDEKQVMVGGGLFHFTKDEGLYATGAYNRNFFSKPLGHVVQFRAIQELKARGVSWYKIGYLPLASDIPQPTAKEISIGEFKQGFASHLFPKCVLRIPVS